MNRIHLRSFLAIGLLAFATAAVAAPAPAPAPAAKKEKTKAPQAQPGAQAPLPANVKAAWTHAPYAAGDCSICHERNDAKNPGKLVKQGNDLCFMCHDEFQPIMARKHPHAPAKASCVACHNAHDARQAKLLHAEASALCLGCHADVKSVAEGSKVKHDALTQGKKCLGCHNPHASNVEKLLTQLPFDLCVSCHSVDGLKDDDRQVAHQLHEDAGREQGVARAGRREGLLLLPPPARERPLPAARGRVPARVLRLRTIPRTTSSASPATTPRSRRTPRPRR